MLITFLDCTSKLFCFFIPAYFHYNFKSYRHLKFRKFGTFISDDSTHLTLLNQVKESIKHGLESVNGNAGLKLKQLTCGTT